jgi:hypothetical protein
MNSRLYVVAAFMAIAAAIVFRLSPSYLKIKVAVQLMGWDGLFVVARETVSTRVLGSRQTQSRMAFHKLLDSLSEVDIGYCIPQRRIVTEDEIAECHRLISHLTSTGFRLFYETDLDRPHFEPIVGPRMKSLGDNPDALYFNAVFNPNKDYVVKGSLRGEVYLSFTVYEAACVGCFSQKVVADVNNFQLKHVGPNGEFELIVSQRSKPTHAESQSQDFLSISNLGQGKWPQLITRHYYENQKCAQLDYDLPKPNLTIHLLKDRAETNQMVDKWLNDATSAERMERVNQFVRSHTLDMIQDPAKAPSWFSFTPNVFGPAVLFRDEVVGLGAVDIVYSAGPFVIKNADTEGVLIEAIMPKAKFVNIVLWNKLLQTLAYEDGRPVSLNRKQMKSSNLDPVHLTGKVKILVSKRYPKNGLPSDVEWLDSEGRSEGSMFWRFLLPESEVDTPKARLIILDELTG